MWSHFWDILTKERKFMRSPSNYCFQIFNLPRYSLFLQYINKEYKPYIGEIYGEEDKKIFKYPFFTRVDAKRFYLTLKYINLYFPKNGSKVIDIGGYPGTMLKLLRKYSDIKYLYQCGLYDDPDFLKEMDSYDIVTLPSVDLDPPVYYQKELEGKHNFSINLDNESVDFIIATEIIEHLVYPLHFLSEAIRILKAGGRLLITTPNVAKSSAWVRVLMGKSNLDRLEKTQICMRGNWRGHVRLYSKEELITLLLNHNFNILVAKAFTDFGLWTRKSSLPRKMDFLIRMAIEFFLPWTKPGLLVIAEKAY
jgi:SAM-dependent methyltransferase